MKTESSTFIITTTTSTQTSITRSLRFLSIIFALIFLTPYPHYKSQTSHSTLTTITKPHLSILRHELLSNLHSLSNITENPNQLGVNRPFLSNAGNHARQFLLNHFRSAGLYSYIDGAGNVIGTATCSLSTFKHQIPRRRIVMGSHIDTVPNGGMWDGTYGVLASLAIAKVLFLRGGPCTLPFDYTIVAFDDEEGNNQFGTTNFGARAFAGVLNYPEDVPNWKLFAKQYSKAFSIPSNQISKHVQSATYNDSILAFLELHLEQGPVLESRGRPIGAVDAIAGQTRLLVDVIGHAGHAGTVPMGSRHDSLTTASEAILLVEQIGRKYSVRSLVATVGKLDVFPGTSNVISGQVQFTVDIRAPVDADRLAALREMYKGFGEAARKRNTKLSIKKVHEVDAVAMTPWVTEIIEQVVTDHAIRDPDIMGIRENTRNSALGVVEGQGPTMAMVKDIGLTTMTSGAGHDTQFMAKITDVGMVFVRCKDGLSHHPDEHVSDDDAYEGALTLLRVVDKIADKVRKEVMV